MPPRTGPASAAPAPRRALIVSAAIGEGHNATGRALQETIARIWPGCEVRWLDVLESMGPGIGPMARAFYVMQIERTPWIYEFFFRAIWRYRWFLNWSKRLIGSWCGRGMSRAIRRYEPDLIISTYPLGSAGLSWLRDHRGLDVPTGAWVSDFCPHPYWLYGTLDVTYVMHASAVPVAEAAEPGARIRVGALPVTREFHPRDQAQARRRLGIAQRPFVVLLTTGSLGFGRSGQAVSALLAADPEIQVVAVCGRNERRRERLEGLGFPDRRVRVLGWTDDMPGWLTAADVVVTNGGGVTALEAIACRRPLVMFDPIAGHGKTNASLMASSGAALLCASPADLTAGIRRLVADRAVRARLEKTEMEAAASRDKEDDLRQLATCAQSAPAWR
jgi:UDP-N-acetylglucosamine:LPS N-acetylglucosamine transferase